MGSKSVFVLKPGREVEAMLQIHGKGKRKAADDGDDGGEGASKRVRVETAEPEAEVYVPVGAPYPLRRIVPTHVPGPTFSDFYDTPWLQRQASDMYTSTFPSQWQYAFDYEPVKLPKRPDGPAFANLKDLRATYRSSPRDEYQDSHGNVYHGVDYLEAARRPLPIEPGGPMEKLEDHIMRRMVTFGVPSLFGDPAIPDILQKRFLDSYSYSPKNPNEKPAMVGAEMQSSRIGRNREFRVPREVGYYRMRDPTAEGGVRPMTNADYMKIIRQRTARIKKDLKEMKDRNTHRSAYMFRPD